jgi:hypothetical protein
MMSYHAGGCGDGQKIGTERGRNRSQGAGARASRKAGAKSARDEMPGNGQFSAGADSRLSVPCQHREGDAGDFALRIEAEEKAGRIAAREVELHQTECLVPYGAALENFGAPRRRSVVVEAARHVLHRAIRQLGAIRIGKLRAVDLACPHLRVPSKRKIRHAIVLLRTG